MEVRVLLWQPAAAMYQSYFEFDSRSPDVGAVAIWWPNFGQSVLSGTRRRGPEGRTLGPYPRGSRFDSDRRLCLLAAKNEGSFTC